MKKTIIFIGIALTIALSICACTTSSPGTTTKTEIKTVTVNSEKTLTNTISTTIYETKPAETVYYTDAVTVKEIVTKVSPVRVYKTIVETDVITTTINNTETTTTTVFNTVVTTTTFNTTETTTTTLLSTVVTTTTLTSTTSLGLVKFTIDGWGLDNITFLAKEGQTFEEWLNDDDFFGDWSICTTLRTYINIGKRFGSSGTCFNYCYDTYTTLNPLYVGSSDETEIPLTHTISSEDYYHRALYD